MKHFLAIIILIGLLFQTFNKVIIFSGYLLNKNYITQKYCVNKNKPKLHCNGKCHLKKQLKEQDNSEKKNIVEVQDFLLFYEHPSNAMLFLYLDSYSSKMPYTKKLLDPSLSSVFHPPTVN